MYSSLLVSGDIFPIRPGQSHGGAPLSDFELGLFRRLADEAILSRGIINGMGLLSRGGSRGHNFPRSRSVLLPKTKTLEARDRVGQTQA